MSFKLKNNNLIIPCKLEIIRNIQKKQIHNLLNIKNKKIFNIEMIILTDYIFFIDKNLEHKFKIDYFSIEMVYFIKKENLLKILKNNGKTNSTDLFLIYVYDINNLIINLKKKIEILCNLEK